jgi:hypothetical protein
MEQQLLEKSGRKKYTTGRNGGPENGKEWSHSAYAVGMSEL